MSADWPGAPAEPGEAGPVLSGTADWSALACAGAADFSTDGVLFVSVGREAAPSSWVGSVGLPVRIW